MESLPSLLPSSSPIRVVVRRAAGVVAALVLTACATGPAEHSGRGEARLDGQVDAFSVKAALCFTYLEDPQSRDRKNWDDLLDRTDKVPLAKHVIRFQLPKDGVGEDVNMDYYALTFDAPPNMTVDKFFAQMRKDFHIFAAWDGGYNVFRPYGPKVRSAEDPAREENEKKWAEADHKGALMTFLLAGLGLSKSPTTDLGSQFLVVKQYGDVQSICSSPTDFIFATVETETDTHPVSGLRGFGLKEDSGKKTWTFYSKAVDRRSKTAVNIAHESGVVPLVPDVYVEGRKFWSGFYAKMVEYLKEKNISVRANVSENCNLAKWGGSEFRKCPPL